MGAFTKFGFSLTPKGRFTVVLADGPLAECVRITVKGNLLWVEPHRNGIYGSKYNNRNMPNAWSYQITKSGIGTAWSELIARYPNGVAMMELDEPMRMASGGLRFHLPGSTKIRATAPKPLAPRRVKGHNGRKHRGSNGTPVVQKPPQLDDAPHVTEVWGTGAKRHYGDVELKVNDDKPFLLPSKTVGYPEEGLDIPTAIHFLNAVKRGFGECFEMTIKPNGELRAAIFEEFE